MHRDHQGRRFRQFLPSAAARPRKLLLVSTGNIKNLELEKLFLISLPEIVAGFQQFDFLEITRKSVISHV
jgi:predicted nuclease of predicted toxin-antitoxin system